MSTRPTTVVAIDDDPLNHKLVAAILRHLDVEIHHAHDGPGGLALVRAQAPDVVLLDYDMDGMDGLDVLRTLKADEQLRHIPVVFATGTDDSKLLTQCFAAGAADYVRKPLCAPELRARITSVVSRQLLTEQLQNLAYHDPLTGLANRRAMGEHLAARLPVEAHGAMLYLDMDGFKGVNDHLGHARGDELLVTVATRLQRTLQQVGPDEPGFQWFASRLGGDEFAVFLHGLDSRDASERIAQQLVEALAEPYRDPDKPVFSSTSMGLVHLDRTTTAEPERLLSDADTAMYEAKKQGGNRLTVFDLAMREALEARHQLEHDVRIAMHERQFHLEYQPIIDLQTGLPYAVEALIRWNHPTRGRVSPMSFIPLAEETGLIIGIGDWVLDHACETMARWQRDLGSRGPQAIHVNLSRRQLLLDDVVDRVQNALGRYGLEASRLHLEVTENELMQDLEGASAKLSALRELGVRIDMDDFGTGHSSLSCLQHFPLDVLKVDRSFLRNLGHQREFAALLHAIATLAKNLDLQVVAEGIEESQQLAILQALDVDFGQGWLFCKALPEEELIRYFSQGAAVPS